MSEERLSYQAEAMISLLKERGVYGLAGGDGCRCAHFSNHSIDVDLSCHKSSGVKWHQWGVLRVSSSHSDIGMRDYQAVAQELLVQLREPSWEEEYGDQYWLVRFCTWKQDQEQSCVYCAEPREDERGYLCNKCLVGAAETHDYRRIVIAA